MLLCTTYRVFKHSSSSPCSPPDSFRTSLWNGGKGIDIEGSREWRTAVPTDVMYRLERQASGLETSVGKSRSESS